MCSHIQYPLNRRPVAEYPTLHQSTVMGLELRDVPKTAHTYKVSKQVQKFVEGTKATTLRLVPYNTRAVSTIGVEYYIPQ